MGFSFKMLTIAVLFLVAVASAHDGAGNHVLKWTITGKPFSHCIAPGATVKFDWEGPFHNVEKVDKRVMKTAVDSQIQRVLRDHMFLQENEKENFTLFAGLVVIAQEEIKKQSSQLVGTVEKTDLNIIHNYLLLSLLFIIHNK